MGLFNDEESKGQYLRRSRKLEAQFAREKRWDREGDDVDGCLGIIFFVVFVSIVSSVDPKTDSVDPKSLVPSPYYVHTKSGVNIRSGPGTSYKVIGIINRGDEVYVNRDSYRLSFSGDKKWVKTYRYLTGRFIYEGYVYRPLLHWTVSRQGNFTFTGRTSKGHRSKVGWCVCKIYTGCKENKGIIT